MIYAFGDYELDTQLYELRHVGAPRKLEPQVFDLLAYLMHHRDRVVTKQELLDHLWPGLYVSDATLYHHLMTARKAIGDSGRAQRVIKTLHGRGYRFVAPVEARDPEAVSFLPAPVYHAETPVFDDAEAHALPSALYGTQEPGAQPNLRGERKVVTACCGTLANAATLAEAWGFETLQRLWQVLFRLVHDEVTRYGGVLQPCGDNTFLALFGVPAAYEDHARRAVLAALGLQRRLSAPHTDTDLPRETELAVCMGVHTGPVMIGQSGNEPPSPASVVGEAVTLANWLQRQAGPETLLVSETTLRLLQGDAHAEVVGLIQIPGQSAPIMAYRVREIGPWRAPLVLRGAHALSRFVGRQRELAILRTLLSHVEDGQGQVVGMMGEPGMGKSRLLYEFAQQLTTKPAIYMEGHCVSYGSATPYLPLLTILRGLCGITDTDNPETIIAKVHQRVQEVGLAPTDAASSLLRLLGVSEGTEPLSHLSPQAIKARTFETLKHLCLHVSQRQPLVIAVENLHWIDPTSEAWLASLVEELANAPLLLLTTYRPGYRPLWMEKSYATQVALPQLTPRDSLVVVQSVLQRRQLSDALVQEILTKAAGNPFFLEELTRTLVERNANSATLAVPETVQMVLAARIDRLPPLAKRLLQMAAVIGRDVPFALLRMVAELPEAVLDETLRHLQTAEFLYEVHRGSTRAYTFKHVLTQEVAYQSLLHNTRQQMHRRIAQVLVERFAETVDYQPELLAYHYTEAGLIAEATDYWYRAGRRAHQHSASAEAIAHLTRGLEVVARLPETSERFRHELMLYRLLRSPLAVTKSYAASELERINTRVRALFQQVDDPEVVGSALAGLWTFYIGRGELQTAYELAEQFFALAPRRQTSHALVWSHLIMGETLTFRGEFTRALEYAKQALAFYNPQQHRPQVTLSQQDPGVTCRRDAALALWHLGYPDQALRSIEQGLALAEELQHPYTIAWGLNGAARIHLLRRETHAALRRSEAAYALATEQGFSLYVAQGTIVRGWCLVEQGQVGAGIAQMRQGLAALRDSGVGLTRATWLGRLAEAYGRIGQTDTGLRLLAEALAVADEMAIGASVAELSRRQGELLGNTNGGSRLAESTPEECFQKALDIAGRQQAKSLELRAAISLSRLWQQRGKRQEAKQLLTPIYNWFTEGFDTQDIQDAQALLGELS